MKDTPSSLTAARLGSLLSSPECTAWPDTQLGHHPLSPIILACLADQGLFGI
ncbi:hypothetical protein P4H39_05145 [Paenibacillus lautus]|uniref:hypothetical protein n=1 Tax=Paenibacillus lautus TaxID=1401 RepID=UPI002DBB47A1|nr:hypothetical protein [Paenibacillus lautus]MEC0202008.1 hypothetical protein [Paenibacillus lautus]